MKNLLHRAAAIFSFSSFALLMGLSCSEPYVDRYDPTYRGDYELSLSVEDSSEFFAFVPVNVPFSYNGDDRYVSFSVSTEPEGFVDTLYFRASNPEVFSLYFTAPFSGNVEFRARRHNGRTDTLSLPLTVRSPFEINGNEFLVRGDTVGFDVSIVEGAQKAAEVVRYVSWILDTSLVLENASLDDTFSLFCEDGQKRELKLICTDFKGNQFTTEAFVLGTLVSKPAMVNVNAPVFSKPDTPLEFVAEIRSAPLDSGSVRMIIGEDTLKKSVSFNADSVVDITLLHSEGIPDTGRHSLRFEYESSVYKSSSQPYCTFLPVIDHEYYLEQLSPQPVIAAGDSAEFSVAVFGDDGTEVKDGSYSWTVMLSEDTLFDSDSTRSPSITVHLPAAGTLRLYARFTDKDGVVSQELVEMREVADLSALRPHAVFATPSPAFTAAPVIFQLPVPETADSTVISDWVMENGDGEIVDTRTVKGFRITNRFYEPGVYTIRGTYPFGSGVVSHSCTLDVLDGSPLVDSLVFSPRVLFHKEKGHISMVYTATGNVAIEKYEYILTKDDDTLKFETGLSQIDIPFKSSHTGEWTISARVKNSNDLWSEMRTSPEKMRVESGLPEVAFFGPDTVLKTRVSEFTVSAQDHDGSIEKITVDWGDGFVDTLAADGSTFSTKMNHTYADSSEKKTFEIRVSAIDDMGQKSTVTANVYVADGNPEVMLAERKFLYDGATLATQIRGDTLFTPYITRQLYKYSDTLYNVHTMVTLSAIDGLGQVEKYAVRIAAQDTQQIEWSASGNIWFDFSLTSSFWYDRPGSHLNPNTEAAEFVAFCQSDDGLVDSLLFTVRTVDAPDTIIFTSPDSVEGSKAELAFNGGLKRDYDFITETSVWLNSLELQPGSYTVGKDVLEFKIPQNVPDGEIEVILELTNSVGYKTRGNASFFLSRSMETK